MINRYIILATLAFGVTKVMAEPVAGNDAARLVKQAHDCAAITSRSERLMCFDRLFKTKQQVKTPVVQRIIRPEAWQRAVDSEAHRQDRTGWLKNELIDSEGKKSLWFTVAASSKTDTVPQTAPVILMMSCINSISRLKLVLPEPQSEARAEISLGSERRRWTYDEQGVMLRSGRGLNAISIMRPLERSNSIVMRSNADYLNGLVFQTPNATQSIAELKELCRW